jgi:cell pole-organizing protein PopZ
MKHGQKTGEPRMEDVLASIRRAIDENATVSSDRFTRPTSELRAKVDNPPNPPPRTESPPRRTFDYPPINGSGSHQPQGFAGILGGRREALSQSFRERPTPTYEARPRQPDPVIPEAPEPFAYDGYYGAEVTNYVEPESTPELESEPYPAMREMSPPRYLPPAAVAEPGPDFAEESGLLSESSSAATQAAFNQLAETITRRALGDRPIADIAQELLRGMLKQWLNENLPTIVERLVREEIERVVRRPQR